MYIVYKMEWTLSQAVVILAVTEELCYTNFITLKCRRRNGTMKWPIKTRKQNIVAALAVILVILMITFWVGKDPAIYEAEREKMVEPIAKAETENLAWNCSLTDRDGRTVAMRDLYNAQPVYVVFWMPWSQESIDQIDALPETYAAYHQKIQLIVVALTRDGDTSAFAIAAANHWPMAVYTTPLATASDYNITSVPTSLVIAKGGQISSRDTAAVTPKQLAYKIERAIAQSQAW